MSEGLAGMPALTVVAVRRDRLIGASWGYGLVGISAATAYSFRHLYPTPADRLTFARGVRSNGPVRAMVGRLYSVVDVGGLVGWRLAGFASTLIAVMSVLLVVRHTRADEELGRVELVRSGAVGRQAPLWSALLLVSGLALGCALATSVALVVLGLPLAGSAALGFGLLSVGLAFAGIAAVAAQLTQTSRAANGLSLAVVGIAFLLRAAGDSGGVGWLSWLSPIGWAQLARPCAGNRVTVLALPLTLAGLGLSAATVLQGRRDLGAGVFPARPGPPAAGRWLAGPTGLAWRLHRGPAIAWAAALTLMGVVAGAVAPSVGQLIGGSAQTRSVIARLGGSVHLVDAFLAALAGLVALLVSAYVVSGALRLHEEELADRAEYFLSGSVSRVAWAAGHLVAVLGASAGMLALAGAGMGVSYGLQTGDPAGQVPHLVGALLSLAPAVWVIAAAAFALAAGLPRAARAGWGLIAALVLLDQFGLSLGFPPWVVGASPFAHLASLPGGHWTAMPGLIELGVASALLATGLAVLRRRDLT